MMPPGTMKQVMGGMFDKMLFEAAASGCLVLAVSEDFSSLFGREHAFEATATALAQRLEEALQTPSDGEVIVKNDAQIVQTQGLPELALRLVESMAN